MRSNLPPKNVNQKFRYHTWWWGRWVMWTGKHWISHSGEVFGEKTFANEYDAPDNEWEPYEEERHGERHSTLDSEAPPVP